MSKIIKSQSESKLATRAYVPFLFVFVCVSFQDQDLCKLYCIAEGFDFFFSLSNQVQDGTPCSENSRNVCVDGRCEVMMTVPSLTNLPRQLAPGTLGS